MPWESRKGGEYLYRKERVGSRVVSRYVGKNSDAMLISQIDQARRAENEARRQFETARRAEFDSQDAKTDEVFELTESVVDLALVALGFYQHKSTWRRTRDGGETRRQK